MSKGKKAGSKRAAPKAKAEASAAEVRTTPAKTVAKIATGDIAKAKEPAKSKGTAKSSVSAKSAASPKAAAPAKAAAARSTTAGSTKSGTAAKKTEAPARSSVKEAAIAPAPARSAKPPKAKAGPPKAEKPPAPAPNPRTASAATVAPAPKAEAPAKPAQAAAPTEPKGQLPPNAPFDPALVLPLDVEKLTNVSTDILAESGKAGVALLRGLESEEKSKNVPEESAEIAKTLGAVMEYWLKDPSKLVEAQKNLSMNMISLWDASIKKATGEQVEPVAPMPQKDARFADPEWNENPYFDFLKQAYFLGSNWAQGLVEKAETLDEHTKRKANFYIRQFASALSPSNFVMTNPELLRQTLEEKGENIARGMKMLAEDIDAGKGELKIRQTDGSKFEVGVNLATTPGKVVYRNDLIELIQYTPTTPDVFKTPLLIVPPWINKFYILDLNAEKSFIRWAVSQGLTVFVISWINPDTRHRNAGFEAYMKKGVLEAIEQVEIATGEKSVNAIGYCVGGTLLAVTLAYIAQGKRPERIKSATFFTTQVDFTYAGDLLAFVDENQIRAVEEMMEKTGYLAGGKMAGAFNMLRPNDLIWSYMVNNYLKGKQPPPFDLLFWNSDSTRMAEANHSFYLRNCYLNNNLTKKKMVVGSRTLDLSKVKIPIYNLAAKEDHIAPAKSVFVGSGFFGGPVTYVMAGSGHIAGVINPVSKPKYQYWTGGPVKGAFEDWAAKAVEHPGTWWPHWLAWVTAGDKKVGAREPGGGKLKPLCDAPGTYVKIRS